MKSRAGFTPQPGSLLLAACTKPSFSVPKPKDQVYCTAIALAEGGEDRLLLHMNRQRRNSGGHHLFSPCRTSVWMAKVGL